ncbi:MAG: exodeoxyribonuclease VII small subunit [Prevotellaceae bacterium]|nr:exodeoxyribonuclease VII small subunit [Prevotellaceae bacterium]MDO4931981.1 exodeoxyribonuclease VII small subunit [Prevotellaceae bacterium]
MKEPNYEVAMRQLEEIVQKMESGELNVDSMIAELKKAKKLIKLCRGKLTKTEEEIKKILAEEDVEG